MRLVAWTLATAAFTASGWADDWWNPSWACRQRVDINTSLLDEDLTDFPLGVRLTGDRFPHEYRDAGASVRAVDSAGNVLDSEIVQWGPDSAELYIRMPRIRASGPGERFYLYYGNPSAGGQTPKPVWDRAYRAVLHLNGDSTDAAGGPISLSVEGDVAFGPSAAQFDETPGFLALGPAGLEELQEQITITVRFQAKSSPGLQTLASGRKVDGPEQWFNFGLKLPNIVHTNATSRGQRAPELNLEGIAPGQWHSAVVRYDSRNRSRTVCIDGLAFQRDDSLSGPLEIHELRIGRGMLHFDPWQFHGAIDEVRIANVARGDSWLKAEAASLADDNVFAAVGLPQTQGAAPPPPGAFSLLAPVDGLEWKKRNEPVRFSWTPSAGADSYRVLFYDSPDGKPLGKGLEVQSTSASMQWAPPNVSSHIAEGRLANRPLIDVPRARSVYWSVVAHSPEGETAAGEIRRLEIYNWVWPASTPIDDAVRPELSPAPGAEFHLTGYLRTRIDKAVQNFLVPMAESNPAILQVFRDRDKTPLRDPLVPWAGEFAGKYLTSAQLAWRLTRDEALKQSIDQFVMDLVACQAENGYLGPFPESSRLTGGNWDVWGHYHCMLGLLLYYEDTKDEAALNACRKAADLLFETFGPGGPTLTNDGAGGQMNMAVCHGLLLLYKKTGVSRYLELAKYIVEEAWNEPGAGRYLESAVARKPLIEFPQHRWEAMHDWQALAELYWLTGDEQYRKAFEHIWHSAVQGDRHNTGGITSGEGFTGSPYHTGAIETCCTVAWIAMSIDMLRMTGNPTVADEIEWSTLNSALGAIPYNGRTCAYNVPMDGTRTFGVELHWQAPKGGPDLNCCSVNAKRPLGMISQWALMQHADGLTLNFYGPGEMSAKTPSGNRIRIIQDTAYPADGRVQIQLNPEKTESFELRLRIPQWSAATTVTVNGQSAPETPQAGTYLSLSREWTAHDIVAIEFDFKPRTWPGEETFAGKVSVYRGPILFAYDARYNEVDPDRIPPIDPENIVFEEYKWNGAIPPWIAASIQGADGTPIRVVDVSSAGQTGNHYVTWLPKK